MLLKGKCCYILSAAGVHPPTFCLKTTGYVMATDAESGKPVRVYNSVCKEHAKVIETSDDED